MDDDLKESYRMMKEENKRRKEVVRKENMAVLDKNNVKYTLHNGGYHAIILDSETKTPLADFYPSTSKVHFRYSKMTLIGVDHILEMLKERKR